MRGELGDRREAGHRVGIADALRLLGEVAMAEGDLTLATASLDEALGLQRALGDPLGVALVEQRQARLWRLSGDLDRAGAVAESALAGLEQAGDRASAASCRAGPARIALAQGEEAKHERASSLRSVLPQGST